MLGDSLNMLDALANPVGMIIFAFVMVQAALSDLTTMQIRNTLVVFFLGSFIVLAPLAGFTGVELGASLIGSLLVLLVGFFLFCERLDRGRVTPSSRP